MKEIQSKRVQTSLHWGAYQVEVEDNRVVAMHPFADDPDPSPIGQSTPDAVHHKCRIAQPMVRQGWLEKGPQAHGGGRDLEPFVPVSWDRALDLVAGELRRYEQARYTKLAEALPGLSWSLQRADHGEQPYWMAAVLAAIVGQIGLLGGGNGYGYGAIGSIGNPTKSVGGMALPQGENPVKEFIPPDILMG
jgi:anaerobic selenocysteine-containing dehydrogenase